MMRGEDLLVLPSERLHRFSCLCLRKVGVRETDAAVVADVLSAADLRGVDSHGIARLHRYVHGVRDGKINAQATLRTVVEGPATAALDADNGLGQPAGVAAMKLAMEKAAVTGVGVVSVRRTNHFGIAGYYAMLALERGMMGFATTNASPQVAPTFGAEPMFGTNPIAVAVPGGGETPFVLDMATSVVPRGKLERMLWSGQPIPEGWAVDPEGRVTTDSPDLIEGLKGRKGHALLPLGGAGETYGGHKGFGLGFLVDMLCGPLAGAAFGRHVYGPEGANLGHFFAAMRVDAFRSSEEFAADSARIVEDIHQARRAASAERIYVAGEKEAEEARRRAALGVPLSMTVRRNLEELGAECGVEL